MAESYLIACTECGKKLKVGEEIIGKKIRCKDCQSVFVAQKPGAAKPAAKAAKPKPPEGESGAKPQAAPVTAKPQQLSAKEEFERQIAEEAAQGDNPYDLGKVEEGVARCPRCANEMESETAVICLSCGFNIKTRERVETKKVYEHTAGEIFAHRLPGIACVLVLIGLITFGVILNLKVKDWAQGSFLQNEDGTFWLKPGIFGLYGSLFLIMVGIPTARFAIKRLIYQSRPPEKIIK